MTLAQYAVLYNAGREDRDDKPVCLLFGVGAYKDMGRRAKFLGIKRLLDELDDNCGRDPGVLLGFVDRPRVVRIETVGLIEKNDPVIQDAFAEVRRELYERQEAYRIRSERENKERRRELYEELREEFEGKVH